MFAQGIIQRFGNKQQKALARLASLAFAELFIAVHIDSQRHHSVFAICYFFFGISPECFWIQESRKRIPAGRIFQKFHTGSSRFLRFALHHHHGIGVRAVRNDNLGTRFTANGIIEHLSNTEHVNNGSVLTLEAVFAIQHRTFGKDFGNKAEVLRQVFFWNQVQLPQRFRPDIIHRKSRHFFEVFIHFDNGVMNV